jgi:hypothetical protein
MVKPEISRRPPAPPLPRKRPIPFEDRSTEEVRRMRLEVAAAWHWVQSERAEGREPN